MSTSGWPSVGADLLIGERDAASDVGGLLGHHRAPAVDARVGDAGSVVRRRTTARPPLAGALPIPRKCQPSFDAAVGARSKSRSRVRRTTFISMFAKAAPRHRRVPPPNGIHW
jgi:hypothetical protein